MKKILILLLTLIFASCSAKDSMIEPTNPNLETMTFDVVEKKLKVEKALPDKVNDLLTWLILKLRSMDLMVKLSLLYQNIKRSLH